MYLFLDLLPITSNKAIKIFKRFLYDNQSSNPDRFFNSHFLVLKIKPGANQQRERNKTQQTKRKKKKHSWTVKRTAEKSSKVNNLLSIDSVALCVSVCLLCARNNFFFCLGFVLNCFVCFFFGSCVRLFCAVVDLRNPQKRLFVVIGVLSPVPNILPQRIKHGADSHWNFWTKQERAREQQQPKQNSGPKSETLVFNNNIK